MRPIARGALVGAIGGVAGAGAMAATAKVEQLVTGRPSSYVPGRTLAHLSGLARPDSDRFARNMTMHYTTGALVGVLRGVMSAANLRGPLASLMHANVRLTVDQTLENATGVGAPPWTWPRDELAIDLAHKAVYALATGAVTRSSPPLREAPPHAERSEPGSRASPSPRSHPGRGSRSPVDARRRRGPAPRQRGGGPA